MSITNVKFVQEFVRMCNDGWQQGWHERNGGNLSYRIKPEEIGQIQEYLTQNKEWRPIGTSVPGLAGEFFLVTGSGKYFRNVILDPEDNICMIEVDEKGENYRILWGLVNGGRPTSELLSHLMNHEIKKAASGGKHRVIYHAHTTNVIALTFVLPLKDVEVENLNHILMAKETLIRHALGVDDLDFEIQEDKIIFPWFTEMPEPDKAEAYTKFIAHLGKFSKEIKRASSNEKAVENEKYAFRCFLLRLGYIGAEYKQDRKILLHNLTGNSSWKNGSPKKEEQE